MPQYATDTHALIWHIANDRRLSSPAREIFAAADTGSHQIVIPSIVLVEVVYLAERKRIGQSALDQLLLLLGIPPDNYKVAPLDLGVVGTLMTIDRNNIPEMPDRIIAATAKHLGLPLVTRDTAITSSGIAVVW